MHFGHLRKKKKTGRFLMQNKNNPLHKIKKKTKNIRKKKKKKKKGERKSKLKTSPFT